MHGYIGLAKYMRTQQIPISALAELAPEPDGEDFLTLDNPQWQTLGLVMPSTSKTGKTNLGTRNAIQTRRVMAQALIERVTQPAEMPA